MADPCVVGIEMMIHRFDMITMGGNACGVWNIDGEHYVPISWSFLVYRVAVHDGQFLRAWNGASIFQNFPPAWTHPSVSEDNGVYAKD